MNHSPLFFLPENSIENKGILILERILTAKGRISRDNSAFMAPAEVLYNTLKTVFIQREDLEMYNAERKANAMNWFESEFKPEMIHIF